MLPMTGTTGWCVVAAGQHPDRRSRTRSRLPSCVAAGWSRRTSGCGSVAAPGRAPPGPSQGQLLGAGWRWVDTVARCQMSWCWGVGAIPRSRCWCAPSSCRPTSRWCPRRRSPTTWTARTRTGWSVVHLHGRGQQPPGGRTHQESRGQASRAGRSASSGGPVRGQLCPCTQPEDRAHQTASRRLAPSGTHTQAYGRRGTRVDIRSR